MASASTSLLRTVELHWTGLEHTLGIDGPNVMLQYAVCNGHLGRGYGVGVLESKTRHVFVLLPSPSPSVLLFHINVIIIS
jgi:hypothetical protein